MPIFMFFFLAAILEDVFDNRSQLASQQSTELTSPPIEMDSSVSSKEEIWFLRLCHYISNAVLRIARDEKRPTNSKAPFSDVIFSRLMRTARLPVVD